MTWRELDYIFPFVVFSYGLIVTLVLLNPKLVKIAEQKLPSEMWAQFQAKRTLALLCLVIGAVWSLQNIWLA
ncbi:MAG: hypothetical protein SGI74_14170 [Oligoflexia bacterium]|nr:hypothetical protein [Oligoflexia bacterium]